MPWHFERSRLTADLIDDWYGTTFPIRSPRAVTLMEQRVMSNPEVQHAETAEEPSRKWAVLVVHGVGDTGPGVTVDNFVSALAANNEGLHPDGRVEVHWLRDPPPPLSKNAPVSAKRCSRLRDRQGEPLFPVHIRRVKVGGATPARLRTARIRRGGRVKPSSPSSIGPTSPRSAKASSICC